MPVYNAENFLAEAVESIQSQTFQDWELVAVDDGSTDSSGTILARFASDDPRVRVLGGEENRGVAAALNRGWREARGELVARLDADDVALPERLARQVRFLDVNASVAVVGSAAVLVAPDGTHLSVTPIPTSSTAIRATLLRHNCLNHPSVMIRRAILEEFGGYRFNHVEDYDLWLRISQRYELANLPEPLTLYRVHPGQVSIQALEEQARRMIAVRTAARVARSTKRDPLADAEELTPQVIDRLHLDQRDLGRSLLAETVSRAALLAELGRNAEAEKLVAEAVETVGDRVRRSYTAAKNLRRAEVLFGEGRRAEAARRILAAMRDDPRYASERIASRLRDRMPALRPSGATR
jgi:glycosyltransferase involved in cell wall biosynthesis